MVYWYPSCLTPQGAFEKGDMGPNKYTRDIRCINNEHFAGPRYGTQGFSPPFFL